jgi:hypothetical protein
MRETRKCHAATVSLLGGVKYLVDITIPIHSAVRIDPQKIIRRRTEFHNYTIRPVDENKYEVERSHHSNRNAFTLIDIPVELPDFQLIVQNDYQDTGFFLSSVVMNKAIGNKTWRFFSENQPYRLESFNKQGKQEILIPVDKLPETLGKKFEMPVEKINLALALTGN